MAAQRKPGERTEKRRSQERREAPEAARATPPALVTRTPTASVVQGSEPRADLTDEGLALLEALAAEGCDQRTLAARLGISPATLREMRERDEQVALAWGRGLARLADELTHILLTHARGVGKGAVVAAIFLAKARLGWREGAPAEGHTQAVQVNIQIPPAMSAEEFRAIVERGQAAAA